MIDKFNRNINYLRISVTDRCNLRCTYCMPSEGVKLFPKTDILSFSEIVEVVRASVKIGINKIRLTGGEPLVRKDITELVRMIKSVEGINDLGLTTNGILLNKFAKPLSEAGLNRVNISLDTLDPVKFKRITRGGNLQDVFKGIKAAKEINLYPIKINCVIFKSNNEPDAKEVKLFCDKNNLNCRFIRQMNMETGEFSIVEGGTGGNCKICNRLRLTSNGYIKPCLFGEKAYSIRETSIEDALKKALFYKPICGTSNKIDQFYNVGG